MGLLPANATALERALEGVLVDMLDTTPIPIRTLRDVATCPEEWLPWLAWERDVDVWNGDWPTALKRAVVAASFLLHSEKGTVAADRRILDGAGAVYSYAEGAGADHHTVEVKVHNSGALLVTVGDLRRSIGRVKRASVHYTLTAEAGLCGSMFLAGGVCAVTVPCMFEGGV